MVVTMSATTLLLTNPAFLSVLVLIAVTFGIGIITMLVTNCCSNNNGGG